MTAPDVRHLSTVLLGATFKGTLIAAGAAALVLAVVVGRRSFGSGTALLSGESQPLQGVVTTPGPIAMAAATAVKEETSTNPLLADWNTEFGLPPFNLINPSHYEEAFGVALPAHIAEVQAIASNPEEPTFENTIAAFDRSGALLKRVEAVFDNLCLSDSPPELQKVQMSMAGPLSEHNSAIYTTPGLFERIDKVHADMSGLNPEQVRMVERLHLDFVRTGARFDGAAQARYAETSKELAQLMTQFTQNVLADEASWELVLEEADMAGLPQDTVMAAKGAAASRGYEGKYVITLSRSSVVPFLTFSDRRDLRHTAWQAWISRGELDPDRDNKALALKILELRQEQARMHGYKTPLDFALSDTMAGTPAAVMELMLRVWEPAKVSANQEREALQEFLAQGGAELEGSLEPWDWRYYAEKVRVARYNLESSEVKPYFSLDRMVEAVFDCANRLWGLRFVHRPDLVAYHPDVKVYECRETVEGTDRVVGLFLHDNFARPNKQGGAWMSAYRGQSRNGSESGEAVLPIIVNNNNFAKAAEGEPTLLSFDDARTLFHEFGHGMHGMLSDVTYQRLAGTSVLRDFVELPSQLFEHWLSEPEVLEKHARHVTTNEPIPAPLLEKFQQASKFNMGFDTVEYTACALVDQALHALPSVEGLDLAEFEKAELERLGMPQGIVLRHRLPHFLHLFSGSAYAAQYYCYLWAEVLDADGFDAFLETGNPFDPATAQRLRQYIYSSGNTIEPGAAYRAFRGRDPVVEPMLKKKGLVTA